MLLSPALTIQNNERCHVYYKPFRARECCLLMASKIVSEQLMCRHDIQEDVLYSGPRAYQGRHCNMQAAQLPRLHDVKPNLPHASAVWT